MTIPELRPMNLGELLDRIFSLYRRHLWLFVGIMAIPSLLALAMALFLPSTQQPFPTEADPATDPALVAGSVGALILGFFIMGLVYWVVYTIALGATSVAVSQIQLGQAATVREAYQKMRGKIWPLLGVMISIVLRAYGLFILIAMGVTALVAIAGVVFGAGPGAIAGGLLAVVAIVVGLVLAGWVLLGYGVAIPAVALEGIRSGPALKRSTFLTRGHRGKVFLILFLTALVTYAAMALFQGPFWLAFMYTVAKGQPSALLNYLSAVSGTVAGALVGPLMMIGLALLYFDLRIRKEALDLQVMMDRLAKAAPAVAPASSLPPSPIG